MKSHYMICDKHQVAWDMREHEKCPQCNPKPYVMLKPFQVFHPELAKQMRKHAGEKYRPSNGTEGDIFMEEWCANCAKDKCMSEGKPFDECEPQELCPLIGATHLYDVDDPKYPAEWIYGGDGQPRCTAFVAHGEELPPVRCEKTIDMFGGLNEQRA